jgi:iron complex outermembrane receptor protein
VKRLLIMSGACGVLASAISVALAAQGTNEVAEVVIVTGSYIRGTAEDAALPVDVITAEDLAKQGAPTTLELIKSLTVSNGVLGDTNQFDARAQGSEGTGSVNLRGFGPTRTLVLLNGRRMVPSPFTGAVDTNLIPTSAIGRVEVLKDGAAATYGSDAIAGVVNFITKTNLKGLDVGADYKGISDSDGDYGVNVSYGWSDDRSSALISGGYQHRSELLVRDRDGAARARNVNPQGGWSAAGNPSTLIPLVGGVPAGVGADPGCVGVGGEVGLSGTTPVCYWQYTQFDALTEKEDRFQVYGAYDYDITDSTKLHVEGLYADTRVPIYRTSPSYAALQAPSSLANGGTSFVQGQYSVAASNPAFPDFVGKYPGFFPVGTTLALIAANRPFALGGNPLFDYGSSEGPRDYQGMRFSASLDGEFGAGVGWNVAYTYMKQDAHREGRDTVVNRYQLALRGFGGANCNVAANTPGANGCFFINPFSTAIPAGANGGPVNPKFSPAFENNNLDVINWMFPIVSTDQTTTISVVDAVLNGKTGITLPGGDLAWAFGGQYRGSTYKSEYSDLNNFAVTPCVNSIKTDIVGPSGCTAAQLAAPTGGLMFLGGSFDADLDQDVYAAFGELSIPITDTFQAQLAARYEDYGGDIGSTFDPKLSLRWQLFDAMALRGSVGTTFRGPLLTDVDAGSVTTLQSIKGTFRAIRTFGNPALEPESATTFNVGAIVKAAGLSASLDYWNFKFDNPIVNEPLGDLVTSVFGAGTTCSLANPLVGRFAFNDANGNGALDAAECVSSGITRVDINRVNGAAVETDGLDLSLRYDFDNLLGGSAAIGVNATYILKYDVGAQTISGVQVTAATDAVGKLNYQTSSYPLPQWKGNLFAEYSHGAHNLRYVMNYIDSYIDQRADIFVASPNNPGGVAITAGRTIDKWITHDIHYLVDLPWEMTLSASVENFTDEDPPLARLDLSYDPFTASALGRSYKVAVRKRFGN